MLPACLQVVYTHAGNKSLTANLFIELFPYCCRVAFQQQNGERYAHFA